MRQDKPIWEACLFKHAKFCILNWRYQNASRNCLVSRMSMKKLMRCHAVINVIYPRSCFEQNSSCRCAFYISFSYTIQLILLKQKFLYYYVKKLNIARAYRTSNESYFWFPSETLIAHRTLQPSCSRLILLILVFTQDNTAFIPCNLKRSKKQK